MKYIRTFESYLEQFDIVYRGQEHELDTNTYIWVSKDEEHASLYGHLTKYKMSNSLNLLDVEYNYTLWENLIDDFDSDGDYDEYKYEPSIEFMLFLQDKGYDGFENGDNILIFDKTKLQKLNENSTRQNNDIFHYKNFEIKLEKTTDFFKAIIFKDNKQIGYISIDDINNDPYVNYSGIDTEYQKQGLGRYVYDLLEKQLGKKITHGDIASSVSAIKLWRKKLNNPDYLPDNFYEYWGEDVEDVLKKLNENINLELSISDYLKQVDTLSYKPLTSKLYDFIDEEGWLESLEDVYNKEYTKKDFEYTQLELSKADKEGLINFEDVMINKFNSFDIKLKELDNYPFKKLDFIDYDNGIVYLIRIKNIKTFESNNTTSELLNFYTSNNINPDNLSYLGKGDFGEAYSIGDGRVLKKTRSKSEFNIAKELINKEYVGFAKIYHTAIIEGNMYIILEELEEDSSIEDMYYQLLDYLSVDNIPIQYLHMLDTDELDLDDNMLKYISDIEDINHSYRMLGIEASDLRPENLGRDSKGKIKAFDIEDKQQNR